METPLRYEPLRYAFSSPLSQRKPIEWKLASAVICSGDRISAGPLSQRKPIEWKLGLLCSFLHSSKFSGPLSQRKPIEWKLRLVFGGATAYAQSSLAEETN